MFTVEHVDRSKPPRPTKYLYHRIMCGACLYKCCLGKSFQVECTEEESRALGLPRVFRLEGHCRCLTESGCSHGEKRPMFCKLFPLQIKKPTHQHTRPSLVVVYWSFLHCPYTTDYVREGTEGWRYRRIRNTKRHNTKEFLDLDMPIEEAFPMVIDDRLCAEALDSLYGAGTAADIKRQMVFQDLGFGFGGLSDGSE